MQCAPYGESIQRAVKTAAVAAAVKRASEEQKANTLEKHKSRKLPGVGCNGRSKFLLAKQYT